MKTVIGWNATTPVPEQHQFGQHLVHQSGDLHLDGMSLAALASQHQDPTPLTVAYLPLIQEKISFLQNTFTTAIAKLGYQGAFHYAYASKANMNAEVIKATLAAGAHYETSSETDLHIIRAMKAEGRFDDSKMVICNGFKRTGSAYANQILALRDLHQNVIPVISHENEVAGLAAASGKLDVGIRIKCGGSSRDLTSPPKANCRFGLDKASQDVVLAKIAQADNLQLRMLHVMVGSQVTDEDLFVQRLAAAIKTYAQLKREFPTLSILNIGGGIPAQMTLDFDFDYALFAEKLLLKVTEICAEYDVPVPDILSEVGRYTVAEHGMQVFKVTAKIDNESDTPWYILNGSMMNTLPDFWALSELFTVLPLNMLDRNFVEVTLGGTSCDSDDQYPNVKRIAKEHGISDVKLMLPEIEDGEELYIAFLAQGAYQEMLGGNNPVGHCGLPRAAKLYLYDNEGAAQYVPSPTQSQVLAQLGYADPVVPTPAYGMPDVWELFTPRTKLTAASTFAEVR